MEEHGGRNPGLRDEIRSDFTNLVHPEAGSLDETDPAVIMLSSVKRSKSIGVSIVINLNPEERS